MGSALPGDDLLQDLLANTTTGDVPEQLYEALHTQLENFITNPADAQLLKEINQPWVTWFGQDLIGNGINGFTGTNESIFGIASQFFAGSPTFTSILSLVRLGDLGDGGFLFGDGGTGAPGVAGVDGGIGGNGGDACTPISRILKPEQIQSSCQTVN